MKRCFDVDYLCAMRRLRKRGWIFECIRLGEFNERGELCLDQVDIGKIQDHFSRCEGLGDLVARVLKPIIRGTRWEGCSRCACRCRWLNARVPFRWGPWRRRLGLRARSNYERG